MEPHPPTTARRLAATLLALALLAPLAPVAAEPAATAGALTVLQDPRDGSRVSLVPGDRALHLVFFAVWCPACNAELTRLRELEARWSDRGYRLVLVAVPARQDARRLASFLEDENPPGELLFDVDGAAQSKWNPSRLPAHILLDPSGTEVLRSAELDKKLEQRIEELLAMPDRRRP